jgi:hypothetical protein
MPDLAVGNGRSGPMAMVAAPAAPRAPSPSARANTAPSDPAPAAVPPEAAQSMNEWMRAWAAKDTDSYLAFYAPDFEPSGLSLAKWREQRRSRLGKPGEISVQATSLRWHMSDARTAVAHFVQNYRSADFSDTMRKQVVWRDVGGRWLILREQAE